MDVGDSWRKLVPWYHDSKRRIGANPPRRGAPGGASAAGHAAARDSSIVSFFNPHYFGASRRELDGYAKAG